MNSAEISEWVRRYVEGSDNPDFRAYARTLSDDFAGRYFWAMQHFARLGGMQNAKVLDVGCGFGWGAVTLSLLGSNHVVANDIRTLMTDVVRERVDVLRSLGAPISVEVLGGDICGLELSPASFDSIFCNQTIEHVHDLEAMFRACYRALKPGGRLVATNDNNAMNARQLSDTREMWRRRDSSWEYIQELKKERPIENKGIKPYAVMREEIVRRANPLLDPEAVREIVRSTAGLVQAEIEQIAAAFHPGSPLPEPPELSWCRDPISGEYCERQLVPFELEASLVRIGFEARLHHAFRRFPLRLFNSTHWKPIDRLLYQLRPLFVLVGTKPG